MIFLSAAVVIVVIVVGVFVAVNRCFWSTDCAIGWVPGLRIPMDYNVPFFSSARRFVFRGLHLFCKLYLHRLTIPLFVCLCPIRWLYSLTFSTLTILFLKLQLHRPQAGMGTVQRVRPDDQELHSHVRVDPRRVADGNGGALLPPSKLPGVCGQASVGETVCYGKDPESEAVMRGTNNSSNKNINNRQQQQQQQ
jgi:hypothetical protein